MIPITYKKGDATNPNKVKGHMNVLVHIVNNMGKMGKGFAKQLKERFPEVEQDYLEALQDTDYIPNFVMGQRNRQALGKFIQSWPEDDLKIYHLVAQDGLRNEENPYPIEYDALKRSFGMVVNLFDQYKIPVTIHMPKMGTGLAGGHWVPVQRIIRDKLNICDTSIKEVIVYEKS